MNLAGGVPFEHRSGVPVSLTPGAVARFGDDSVNVEVGRLHKAAFGVTAFAQASAGDGSASAEISLAISGIVTPPPGYSILFSGSAPAFGAYPNIDAPLSTIPIPAAVWLFVPALMSLRLFRRTKTDA